ncbi:phage holin family protein [Algivirga pacifica]|uniref:Holin-X, holin superfamily III n=1 Tax=Algivirga pacifica TaxID=1162670 RepID=A0ABP9D486_9BACT
MAEQNRPSYKEQEQHTSSNQTDNILNNLTKLVETYLKIFRLELQMTLSDVLTMIALVSIIVLFVTLAVIFISFGIAELFNYLLDLPPFWGYFVVALFYLICLGVIFSYRKAINNKLLSLMDSIFESITDNFDTEN